VLTYTFLHVKLAIWIAPHRTHGCDTPQRWALKQCRRATCHLPVHQQWLLVVVVPCLFKIEICPCDFPTKTKLRCCRCSSILPPTRLGIPLPNTTRPSKNANPHTPCAIFYQDAPILSKLYHGSSSLAPNTRPEFEFPSRGVAELLRGLASEGDRRRTWRYTRSLPRTASCATSGPYRQTSRRSTPTSPTGGNRFVYTGAASGFLPYFLQRIGAVVVHRAAQVRLGAGCVPRAAGKKMVVNGDGYVLLVVVTALKM
jgi:hypothetical protein